MMAAVRLFCGGFVRASAHHKSSGILRVLGSFGFRAARKQRDLPVPLVRAILTDIRIAPDEFLRLLQS
jgi:hypothetical protein